MARLKPRESHRFDFGDGAGRGDCSGAGDGYYRSCDSGTRSCYGYGHGESSCPPYNGPDTASLSGYGDGEGCGRGSDLPPFTGQG